MSQHFLLSARARTLSLAQVMRLTDAEAEQAFMTVRWHDSDGKPVCPHCDCPIVWDCRKANGAPRWRCKACRKSFSITSGTIFAHHKLNLRDYLAAIAIFVNEAKGKSALALSRDLDVQYKTAFVLSHKIREAMANELKGMQVGGEGKTVETDGGYFGGYVKPANHKENRRDRRLAKNQNGKRKVVVVVRERGGRTLPEVFRTEAAATSWISGHGSARIRSSWPTRRLRGTICTPGMKSPGSTMVSCTARAPASSRTVPSRVLFQPETPRRDRTSPPYRGRLPDPVRPGIRLARRSPPTRQWTAGPADHRAGHGLPSERGFFGLLAET